MHMYIHVHTHTDIHAYSIHAYTNTRYIYGCTYTDVNTQRDTCTYTCIYTHMHMYIQHTHAQINTSPTHVTSQTYPHTQAHTRAHTHISRSERWLYLALMGSKLMQSTFINSYLICCLTFTIIFTICTILLYSI